MITLPLIWGMIIAFCIVMYVILDGFTLGTGMLLPWLDEEQCHIGVSVLLPTWDGNQTWLVLGLAALYGAFPLAFSLLCPALYLPLLLMGIALLLRGITFEFRLKSQAVGRWDIVFALSSLVITLIQGLILGDFVLGFSYDSVHQQLTTQGLIHPFSVFTALSLVIGYGLLGVTRLILKTTGALQKKLYPLATLLGFLMMFCIGIVSLWTPFVNDKATARWFDPTLWPYIAFLPIFTLIAFVVLIVSLHKRREYLPYWTAVVMFLCPYLGFAISAYPYIIPYQVAYYSAAAPHSTLLFILAGAVVIIPVLLVYTFYAYWIFRGKVNEYLEY